MVDPGALRLKAAAGSVSAADLGDPATWSAAVGALADDPVLVPIVSAVAGWLAGPGKGDEAAAALCQAVVDAVAGSSSPAVFRDCADVIGASPEILEAAGARMADHLGSQSAPPGPEAKPASALRAADALEVLARLCASGWGPRWGLFAALEKMGPDQPVVYQRAQLRAAVQSLELWPEAAGFTAGIRVLAGLDPPSGLATAPKPALPSDVELDATVALARASILAALRSDETEVVAGALEDASRYLASVRAIDGRVDAVALGCIVDILSGLVAGEPPQVETVDILSAAVREHEHMAFGTEHWVTDRIVAVNVAWSCVAADLHRAVGALAEPSWYSPPTVLDDIINLYRTSRSQLLFARSDDGEAVRDIIAPVLENGFATQTALLRHLEDHVEHLASVVAAGTATAVESSDLPVALQLRDAARVSAGSLLPKPGAGAAEYRSGTGGAPADGSGSSNEDRILQNVATRALIAQETTGSVVGDELLNRICDGFRSSPDYQRPEVREAADLVSHLLVTFLFHRSRLGEAEYPYLFDAGASEADLASDLEAAVAQSGMLGCARVEVPHVAGGRIDLEFAFPGFNLYAELKVDSTTTPLGDKRAYLSQAVSYQVEGARVGFLVVLRLLKPKQVPPHLSNCLEMVQVPDGSGQDRVIAAFTIAGARTKPSRM